MRELRTRALAEQQCSSRFAFEQVNGVTNMLRSLKQATFEMHSAGTRRSLFRIAPRFTDLPPRRRRGSLSRRGDWQFRLQFASLFQK